MSRVNQRLNGINPLSYLGVDAYQPNDFIKKSIDPSPSDSRNFYLGTWWLNSMTNNLFYLASLTDGQATWVDISSEAVGVETLTGNSGGEVGPTVGNINVVGDGTTINIVGNPSTNTLTISAMGEGITSTLTGNDRIAVTSTAGNINIIGGNDINVIGTPINSTLTISENGSAARVFDTQSGSAVPISGVLTIDGSNGIITSAVVSTVTVTPEGSISQSFTTEPVTGTAIPSSGQLIFQANSGAIISAFGSTVTITIEPASVTYSTGTWTPEIVLPGPDSVTYSRQLGFYVQIGNMVYIQFDVAVTGTSGTEGGEAILTLPIPPVTPSPLTREATASVTFSSSLTAAVYPIRLFSICGIIAAETTGFISLSAPYEVGTFPIPQTFTDSTAFTGSGFYYI